MSARRRSIRERRLRRKLRDVRSRSGEFMGLDPEWELFTEMGYDLVTGTVTIPRLSGR